MTIEMIIQKHVPSSSEISQSTLLFSSGLLDSLSLIDIVQEVEQLFQVKVHWSELNLENFDSIGQIQKYISRKIDEAKH